MMIDAPDHALVARPFLPRQAREHAPGSFERLLKRIQGVMCGLRGHDSVLQYERTRMFLRCTSCGHETPGWEVTPGLFAMRRRSEARPARAGAPTLGIVRKVA
jgi:hypothetical protein